MQLAADLFGEITPHAVRGAREAASDRLPNDEQIWVEPPCGGCTAWPHRDGVRLVGNQERAVSGCELPERRVIAGLREDDADVCECRLNEDRRHVTGR